MSEKMKLYGFNNLTKSLSFNIYDVCYAKTKEEQNNYVAYIDEQYNAERLTAILCKVTEIIGAHVLNISKQDYDPQGASVTILIAEEPISKKDRDASCNGGENFMDEIHSANIKEQVLATRDTVVGHLDKSHVTVHTYPEYHPDKSISSFRVDIDVATCGKISPLNALNFLISCFDSDIITMDYKVRGFTREEDGRKIFIDHDITSIQDYIDKETLEKYDAQDVNVYQSNIFHTKMLIKELELENYLFDKDPREFSPKQRLTILENLRREMIEVYSGRNIY